MKARVLLAGGGLAAQRAAQRLRAGGYDGSIRMLCAEAEPPYDRPPLSKELLAGAKAAHELALRPPAWYEANDVELLLGERAQALEPGARRVRLGSGGQLSYDQLLIATGAEPRRLPLLEGYENVHALRTLADATALGAALTAGARLAVVGAGFIGLEVAATAHVLGAEVTLIEAAAAPLASIVGPVLGTWFAEMHRKEGIDVRCEARLERIESAQGRVRALHLAGGHRVACDAVLVGVGVSPAAQWLAGSGLDPAGVAVDSGGRTAIPRVFAAGDVARPFDPVRGVHVRSEHWEGAVRQAAAAADAMLGVTGAPLPPPSFWSDQHGVRIQLVGTPDGADRIVLDGDPAARDFAATFLRHGHPVAVLLVGRARELPAARRLVSTPERERTAA